MVLCFEALTEVPRFLKLVKELTIRYMQLQYITSSTNLMFNCSSTKWAEKKQELLSIPYLENFQKKLKKTSRE